MKAHAIQAGCKGKERFPTYEQADKAARATAHRRSRKITAYPCRHCKGFHIGNALMSKAPGRVTDPRKPYLVFARDHSGAVCQIGRADKPDGGKLKDVLALDGWEIVKVTRVK